MKNHQFFLLSFLFLSLIKINVFAFKTSDFKSLIYYKRADFGDLRGADLSQRNLQGADLRFSDLRYANLSGANLTGADLISTKFERTNLSKTVLKDAKFVPEKYLKNPIKLYETYQKKLVREVTLFDILCGKGWDWPCGVRPIYMGKVNLTETDLSDLDMRIVFLIEANLTKANLSRTNLSGVDLRRSNLKDVILNETIVDGANFESVKGLNNEQKQYLRDNGALNVSIDIEYEIEEDSKEVGTDILKQTFLRRLLRKSRYWLGKDSWVQVNRDLE